MKPFLLAGVLAGLLGAPVFAADPAAEGGDPIGLTIIGYDVQNDAEAQRQFEAMAKAVESSGGRGKLLNAGVDEGELQSAMNEALDFTRGGGPRLELDTRDAAPGERIAVAYEGLDQVQPSAWIGFYRLDAPDNAYISYTFLNNLEGQTYDVVAPEEPGEYQFRLFLDAAYDAACVSEPVSVH